MVKYFWFISFLLQFNFPCHYLCYQFFLFRNMNFNNVKVPKVPGGGAASALIKLGVVGGLGLYGAINSLYNVEGGHRAIVFNRIIGVKDKVLISPWFLAYET